MRKTRLKERKHSASRLTYREHLLKYIHSQHSRYYYEVKGWTTEQTLLTLDRAKRLGNIRRNVCCISQMMLDDPLAKVCNQE
jgi:hypothetical protein